MASLHQQSDDEWPTFSATTPHFIKMIPYDASRYVKLRIPEKFMYKYGGHLSNPIHLRLPCGSEWEIQLRRCNGEVWFDEGWPEFSKFYSLGYGDCLVFRYEEDSKFHVCIFDRSATEIEYPITLSEMEETDEDDDDVPVEILEDFKPRPKTQKSPLPCPLPHKKKRISGSSDKAESSTSRMRSLTEDEKAVALRKADAFKSDKPHFKIAMQPSYLIRLMLPEKFAKEHLVEQPSGDVILTGSDGGTWPVKFKYIETRARLHGGWSEFVRDNNLKVGDVCVFVLINDIKLSFEVVFYRTIEAANFSLSPAGEHKVGEINGEHVTQRPSESPLSALEAANKFVANNPFFRVTLSSPQYASVPASFAKNFIEKKKQTVRLQVRDRLWRVNLIVSRSRFQLSAGWATFAKDNCLSRGDVCIFELVDRDDILFKVHMFRY